jgi:FkbM family methyltransferase
VPANRKSTLAERALNKPYYLLRPGQALRRVRLSRAATPRGLARAPVPWNREFEAYPGDEIGSDIWRTGVFELVVSETIARLLDPGELAVDAGANIGYMTTLMASRVGSGGRVIAYEPHPDLHRVLRSNAERASRGCDLALLQAALSDRTGTGHLVTGSDFETNMGTAALLPPGREPPAGAMRVPLERLDDRLADIDRVGLIKIDVEGHELSVLRGARRALARRRIRDVVFEEHGTAPTPITRLLESAGYVIFGLDQRVLGPRLVTPGAPRACPLWVAPSLLATLDAERARSRMRPRGWTVLRARPRESRAVTNVGLKS